jgi:hypothetical protein
VRSLNSRITGCDGIACAKRVSIGVTTEQEMKAFSQNTVWRHTIETLGHFESPCEATKDSTRADSLTSWLHSVGSGNSRCYSQPAAGRIVIVERDSPTVLIVRWNDATLGHYGAQAWKEGYARGRGICALTGAVIRRGDKVYRPRERGRSPVNSHWQLLASAAPFPECERADPC